MILSFIKFCFLSVVIFLVSYTVGSIISKPKWDNYFFKGNVTSQYVVKQCGSILPNRCLFNILENRMNELPLDFDFLLLNNATLATTMKKLLDEVKMTYGKKSEVARKATIDYSLLLAYFCGVVVIKKFKMLEDKIEKEKNGVFWDPFYIHDFPKVKLFQKVAYEKTSGLYQSVRKKCFDAQNEKDPTDKEGLKIKSSFRSACSKYNLTKLFEDFRISQNTYL